MFVRKFEADSLDEALLNIKKDLGPDAIILKTVTNKGIKGAFKNKKIEITAAISEKNYVKKKGVDNVLNGDQKDTFYKNNSTLISNMIDNHNPKKSNYSEPASQEKDGKGYGSLGLNKSVNTTKSQVQITLDEFLDSGDEKKNDNEIKLDDVLFEDEKKIDLEPLPEAPPVSKHSYEEKAFFDQKMLEQEKKIENLERNIGQMKKNIENIQSHKYKHLDQLGITLRTLDVNPYFINKITKKLLFELSHEDLENEETVFDFCLREMTNDIEVKMPLFSKIDSEIDPCITILVSESSCGQSSMIKKICSLKKDAVLIEFSKEKGDNVNNFSEKIFVIDKHFSNNVSEVVSLTKKSIEKNKSVFIDFRASEENELDTKSFIESFRRLFRYVEVLVSISAIHSESYNKKIINKYKFLTDGISVSMMDLCLNFGSIFNLCELKIPFIFFGTGKLIPDDLESSTSERVLSGIFQIK